MVACCNGKVLRLSSHNLEAVFKAYLVMLSYTHITTLEFVFLIIFVLALLIQFEDHKGIKVG